MPCKAKFWKDAFLLSRLRMLSTAGNFHCGNQSFGANSLTHYKSRNSKYTTKGFFSFLFFFLEGIQVVEVLVCHWGEDLTGNKLGKELFVILSEGVPCDSRGYHHAKMKCFCRFAKYFID